MPKLPSYFGNFPHPPTDKKPVHLTRDAYKMFIYTGAKPYSSDLNYLLASTDQQTTGIYQLAPGSNFDPADIHAGDEVYYVLEGTVHLLNPATGQTEELVEGDAVLIPKGAWHRGYNFSDKPAVILFCIAPRIWDESGPPTAYDGPTRLYKHEGRA
ncbi:MULTISPECIES: cupin domain-containing protein [Rhizobium]|uniref:Cupin domain-containing protein n=1 Tax=Rhizobium chutanense TaxID=2035448 RepID=A0A3S0T622_9HYPH|nr:MULTISPECIES: cupin domain-containing protein [Rhizobium]RUM08361.1 cupin domain-containing protein [Rhizobium chutanense]WEA58607.1 cupin domain-containing protein [Rhizobium sp. BJ04]